MTTSRIPMIIDTDPGLGEPGSDIDDGLAIVLALRSPEVEVLGLTVVVGNVDLAVGVDVARRLATRLGVPDLPVLAGASAPLEREMAPVRAIFERAVSHRPSVATATQLGPTTPESAAAWMTEQAARRPGEIVVVAIGPMTNLALAIRHDPNFARNVREFVLMAGSATGYAQNITTVGDFNTFVDPEALQIVLGSGAAIRMVGIDQTSRVPLSRADASALRQRGDDFSSWVADCTDSWIDFLSRAFPHRGEHRDSCFLHDPLVIAAVLDGSLLTWADAYVEAEVMSELARGLVIADRGLALDRPKPSNARVAIDTDVERFRQLFLSRISQPQDRDAS